MVTRRAKTQEQIESSLGYPSLAPAQVFEVEQIESNLDDPSLAPAQGFKVVLSNANLQTFMCMGFPNWKTRGRRGERSETLKNRGRCDEGSEFFPSTVA